MMNQTKPQRGIYWIRSSQIKLSDFKKVSRFDQKTASQSTEKRPKHLPKLKQSVRIDLLLKKESIRLRVERRTESETNPPMPSPHLQKTREKTKTTITFQNFPFPTFPRRPNGATPLTYNADTIIKTPSAERTARIWGNEIESADRRIRTLMQRYFGSKRPESTNRIFWTVLFCFIYFKKHPEAAATGSMPKTLKGCCVWVAFKSIIPGHFLSLSLYPLALSLSLSHNNEYAPILSLGIYSGLRLYTETRRPYTVGHTVFIKENTGG